MAAIIKQYDKRSKNTYIYESVSWWDKEKQYSRSKRKLIGKIDKITGEMIPTDGRHRKPKAAVSTQTIERKFGGATFLLNHICTQLGLIDDLKNCFGSLYKSILSIAFFMIIEGESAILRFSKFNALHFHPFGDNITSQAGSELFSSISDSSVNQFFKLQAERRADDEYWAYDTTSISSYSENLRQVQYGYNKENDALPQINLGLLFGEKSNLPFYYRKLSGNISDVTTFETLSDNMKDIGITGAKFVADKGFYSEKNIDMLYENGHKFLLSVKLQTKYIRTKLDEIYDGFRNFEIYDENTELYGRMVTITRKNGCEMYLHYYYNIEKAAEMEKKLDKNLVQYKRELLTNSKIAENEGKYIKFFDVSTDERGNIISANIKTNVVLETKRYYGFFVIASNDISDSKEALQIYRNKDVAEKAFGNIKERLNMRRTLVSSEQSLDGKLFVTFVSLIILSHIKKVIQDNNLFKKYTLNGLIDTFDLIECFKTQCGTYRFGEILENQKNLYALFGVDSPSSLCLHGI